MRSREAPFIAWAWWGVALSGLVMAGCGPRADSNLSKVTGTVTLGGKPLSQGAVSFLGENKATGSSPIDANGCYRANLAPGEYKVAVVCVEDVPDPKGGLPVPKALVPNKYLDAVKSGLTATVQKGDSKIDFDLKP